MTEGTVIDLSEVRVEFAIGLLFQKKGPISWEEAIPGLKAGFLEEAKNKTSGFPIVGVVMPCGEVINYKTFEDIPLHDVPCPCGNPNHWLVKWVSLE